MAAKPILIGEQLFSKKSDALQACRDVLYHYPAGARVHDPTHERFLIDLLQLHPDTERKVGSGIDHFEIRANPLYPNQVSFFIVRTDGSETEFSFTKCLTPPTQRHLVLNAMRQAVGPQVIAFLHATFRDGDEVRCAVTGAILNGPDGAHVDHYDPEFLVLATDYVLAHGGWDAFELFSTDGAVGPSFADVKQAEAWVDHHRMPASLRVVSIRANLSLLRRGRIRPRMEE
ncbi:DCL family protein [Sphaerisporangium sp. TRM90804]|uniref:DCL family protein n=1 Tax=Sphaerisporangium sp. TRM90804 TaxID=3031113 RepID=UPI00244CEE52|nr:DCL family protein [Sphaerisporangium sp. TRM90804]MDH2429680.1 DCL family protein [Sphaerisporangium sp. TRM90804]